MALPFWSAFYTAVTPTWLWYPSTVSAVPFSHGCFSCILFPTAGGCPCYHGHEVAGLVQTWDGTAAFHHPFNKGSNELFLSLCPLVLGPCDHEDHSHCLSPISTWSQTGGDEREEEQCPIVQQEEECSFLPRLCAQVADSLLNAFYSHG